MVVKIGKEIYNIGILDENIELATTFINDFLSTK